MSIEYTIDIQLTELGFPDLVQPRESSGREAGRRSSSSDKKLSVSRPPGAVSNTQKRSPLSRAPKAVDAKGIAEQAENPESRSPAQSRRHRVKTVTEGDDGAAARRDGTEEQPALEDDSDDSDVSVACDEEEVDEDDAYDEEEELDETDHPGDYRCNVCDLQLPSVFKLQDHMNLHTGARPYCCAECGKRFCQIINYRVHLRTHAGIKVDRLMCRVCWVGFTSQEELNNHLSETHSEDRFYECDLCKRVFTTLKDCETHVMLHKHPVQLACEKCGRKFHSRNSLARHQKRRCLSFFKCTDCPLTFTKKNSLLRHTFSHLGLLPYTCVRCRCHFRLAKLYHQHRCQPQRIHCVACLREFLGQSDFEQHKKDTGCWGNQEPKMDEIRCLECGKRFMTSDELKKHAGAHQRVLSCAECGKGFRSALLLMSHMGGHAGQSPCLCQICGIGFPHQQNYDSHLKTCGQAPQLAKAPKKHSAKKSSLAEKTKLQSGLDSSSVSEPIAAPAATTNDSSSPRTTTEIAAADAGPGPADGFWKITLDKEPPPGVNLVLFLPVCEDQSNSLILPSAASSTPPLLSMQAHPQNPGTNSALGAQLTAPLDFVTGNKQVPVCDVPLDLSKKYISSKSNDIFPQSIKGETEELRISGKVEECLQSISTEIKSKKEKKTNSVEKTVEMGPMDLEPIPSETTPPILITDVHSLGVEFDTPGSFQQAQREIKMEVETSSPASGDLKN